MRQSRRQLWKSEERNLGEEETFELQKESWSQSVLQAGEPIGQTIGWVGNWRRMQPSSNRFFIFYDFLKLS